MGREREFRGWAGASQCGGLCAKPVVIGDFSTPKVSGECWSRTDWRSGSDWDPTFSWSTIADQSAQSHRGVLAEREDLGSKGLRAPENRQVVADESSVR
jgi:hypothetical protein